MQPRLVKISKFLAKHLRHKPEALGLTLLPGGWVGIDELLAAAARKGFVLSRAELDQVVAENDKQRFTVDAANNRIRANQGHSVDIDLQLTAAIPPSVLFHGTVGPYLAAIFTTGLKKMARHHVHLSADRETAIRVGARRGQPVVLQVDSAAMAAEGHEFFLSANGVWLVDAVPPQYLKQLDG